MTALLVMLMLASAPEGADPALAPWFQGLVEPGTGVSCCSVAHCRPADAYDYTARGWRVKMDGQWYDVPKDKIINTENPTGRPVACIYGGTVHCFIPPSMS